MQDYFHHLNRFADALEELEQQAEALAIAQEQALRDLLGDLYPAYRAHVDDYDQRANEIASAIRDNEAGLRQTAVTVGHTVVVSHYRLQYQTGRVTWDNRALDGYAAAHPEILAFRKQGPPTVSLRRIREDDP